MYDKHWLMQLATVMCIPADDRHSDQQRGQSMEFLCVQWDIWLTPVCHSDAYCVVQRKKETHTTISANTQRYHNKNNEYS
jgi:hypothetical protein